MNGICKIIISAVVVTVYMRQLKLLRSGNPGKLLVLQLVPSEYRARTIRGGFYRYSMPRSQVQVPSESMRAG
jgi:hypothetical protein